MEENIYYEQNQNKYQQLSDSLTILVNDLKSYKENITKKMKDKIFLDLEKMTALCKLLDGIVEKDFDTLKKMVAQFLDAKEELDLVLIKCVKLKNQLWEL